MDDLVRGWVRAYIEWGQRYDDAGRAELARIESAGGRLVVADYMGSPECMVWKITDWRTGELLSHSDDFPEDERTADNYGLVMGCSKLNAAAVDEVLDWDTPLLDRAGPPPGLPQSLACALDEWAYNAPAEDVAAVTGWDVAKITRWRIPYTKRPQVQP